MNLCKFNQSELTKFDQVIQRDLIRKNIMLERQASRGRFSIKRRDGGRGLKSLRKDYDETKVTCGVSDSG